MTWVSPVLNECVRTAMHRVHNFIQSKIKSKKLHALQCEPHPNNLIQIGYIISKRLVIKPEQ